MMLYIRWGVRVVIRREVCRRYTSLLVPAGISIAVAVSPPSWLSLASSDGATTAPPLDVPMQMEVDATGQKRHEGIGRCVEG